jgi:hypothetical protein
MGLIAALTALLWRNYWGHIGVRVVDLGYLFLVTVSAYTLIGLVASLDGEAVRQRLTGAVPARTAGGILTGLTILFMLINLANIVSALTGQTPVGALEIPVLIADFVVIPAWIIGGVLLWRREALGYVAGAGLFLVYCMLFTGSVVVMVFSALDTGAPLDLVGIVMMAVLAAVCFIPLALFLRGAASDRSPPATWPQGPF